jgi:deoxyribose-phosphate aldolase
MAYTKDIKPTVNKGELKAQVEAQRAKNGQEQSKCEQALAKYNCNVDETEVGKALKKLIVEKVPENDTIEVKKFLLGSVELTSLSAADYDMKIMKMVEKVNKFDSAFPDLPHVAAICVYPNFAEVVKNTLDVDGVDIAVVSGSFPSSQTFIEVKVAETALAVKDGATNVDIVLPVGKFLNEDYEGACEEISELKQTCGDAQLKVILENCLLGSLSNVKKASILSMYAGADYIKTSTGKDKGGATPQDVYVMCQAIKEYYEETGIQVGLKPAGGINSVMDAVIFYTIVKEVLGDKWLTNKWFRLGTSRLTNLLLSEITGEETKWF